MATMPCLPLPRLAPRTIALVLVVASGAMGQCDPVFLAGDASAGIVGTVSALTRWDPDGPGPQPELIVAAGSMVLADNVPVRGIAGHDPVANVWHSFALVRVRFRPDGFSTAFIMGPDCGSMEWTRGIMNLTPPQASIKLWPKNPWANCASSRGFSRPRADIR